MDTLFLSRLQFAFTVGFHFLFPPISIGLAWLLVMMEGLGWRTGGEAYVRLAKVFAKIFALTFAMGVATGITMEFQFGMNWAEYSKFVGDIFGAPLAAEGVFAFFLESGFLGLYLFGRNRVTKGTHFFSIVMVAVGATISAFWILVANSWQQTPAGFVLQNGRAELLDFWAAVFNDSTLHRFFHTILASLVAGSFFAAGICAYWILHGTHLDVAKRGLRIAILFGLVSSLLTAFPSGHEHAVQVAHTQPEKFAVMEGLSNTQSRAPLVIFGILKSQPPTMELPIEIPGIVSLLAYGDIDAEVMGINDIPEDERPPLWIPFVSFHNMVMLGTLFIAIMGWGAFQLWRGRLWDSRWFLKVLLWSIPLPLVAIEFGWAVAEVGRQPWIVYKILRTSDAFSQTVPAVEVPISLLLFGMIYAVLFALYVFLLVKEVKHGPEPAGSVGQTDPTQEVTA